MTSKISLVDRWFWYWEERGFDRSKTISANWLVFSCFNAIIKVALSVIHKKKNQKQKKQTKKTTNRMKEPSEW